jgi:hypothetical protein
MNKRYYSLAEAKDLLAVSYDRVWYACVTGKINPKIVGRTRLLTDRDIEKLRKFFERRKDGK